MLLKVILVLASCNFAHCIVSLSEIGDAIGFVHEVSIDLLQAWNIIAPMAQGEGPEHIDLPYIKDKEKKVFSKINRIAERIDQVDNLVQNVMSSSNFNMKQDIPSQLRLELRIDTLLEVISKMNFADHNFQDLRNSGYLNNSTELRLEHRTLEDFAFYVVSHTPDSVGGLMDQLHGMIYPDPEQAQIFMYQGLLLMIANSFEASLCHLQQSPQQIIHNLYNSLQMTQLKGYTMMQFSWMLLRLYKKGNFTVEASLMRERYLERMAQQVISLKQALKIADAAYWRCDAKHQVEGETYLQLTRLLQGYIQNEVDLNGGESCSENCGHYQVAKQHGCYKSNFCSKQRSCNGDIVECQYIDSDMWVCQADPTNSKRRYEWIEYENGRILGKKQSCHHTSKVDSWWRWVFWHCSYCFCLCDDSTNSDRYFSLRSVLSATDANRVITGIRFVKLNGVVHMQIQEGTLEKYGQINQSSVVWQSVDNFRIKDTVEGKDYIKMSYFNRSIDLDDLIAPPQHVITGVKFRMVGSHLNLEVRATPFNFTSGELIDPGNKDQWLSNDNTDGAVVNPRTKVVLKSPDNPLNSLISSRKLSKHDQFLLFTHSDLNLDAAQTTVPFLDAQIVSPQPPTPLAGVGVYHKTEDLTAGFVGLKVFTYNLGDHIEETFIDRNKIDVIN